MPIYIIGRQYGTTILKYWWLAHKNCAFRLILKKTNLEKIIKILKRLLESWKNAEKSWKKSQHKIPTYIRPRVWYQFYKLCSSSSITYYLKAILSQVQSWKKVTKSWKKLSKSWKRYPKSWKKAGKILKKYR